MANNQRMLCLATCFEPINKETALFWNQLAEQLANLNADLLILTSDSQPQALIPPYITLPDSYSDYATFTRSVPEVIGLPSPLEVQQLIELDAVGTNVNHNQAKAGFYLFDALIRVIIQSLKPTFALFKDNVLAVNRQAKQLFDRLNIPAYFLNNGFLPHTLSLSALSDSNTSIEIGAFIQADRLLSLHQLKSYLFNQWQIHSKNQQTSSFRSRHGLEETSRIISFFGSRPKSDLVRSITQASDCDTTLKAVRVLKNSIDSFAGFQLVFIPDANDPTRYEEDSAFQNINVIRNESEAVLFHESAVVAGIDHPALLKAMLLQKTVLQFGCQANIGIGSSLFKINQSDQVLNVLQKAFTNNLESNQQQAANFAVRIANSLIVLDNRIPEMASVSSLAEFIAEKGQLLASDTALEERWHSFQTGFEMLVNDAEAVIYRLMGMKIPNFAFQHTEQNQSAASSNLRNDQRSSENNLANNAYQKWREKTRFTESMQRVKLERASNEWQQFPSFHLITVCQQGQEQRLVATLESLQQQIYQGWGLTVIANFACPMNEFASEERLEWRLIGNQSFTNLVNQLVAESETDWMALIDCGDLAEPNLIFALADDFNRNPHWQVMYVDDDVISDDGVFTNCRFKPDFNLDLFYSNYYFGGLCAFKRDAFLQFGGFRKFPGAENYDLALRFLEKQGETVFGHVDELLYHQMAANSRLYESEGVEENYQVVLQEYFARCNVAAKVRAGLLPCSHMVEFEHPTQPLVSIIIPTKDRLDLIKPCLDSLLKRTDYPNFEVIVMDNQTSEKAVLDYLDSVPMLHRNVRVICYDHPYNYSAINNFAVKEAFGDYVVLLNNDTVIIQDNWLTRMMAHGQRPEVGVVGAKLLFPDQTIQHAGVILGFGPADHIHITASLNDPGYMGRAQLVQNFSAVTAACLLIRKSIFDAVDGLDEQKFKVLFNDVDLCLKVVQAGYKVVWTPFASLIHHGSSSLKKKLSDEKGQDKQAKDKKGLEVYFQKFMKSDNANMFGKWLPVLSRDPNFNRHLGFQNRTCPQPETEMVPQWNQKTRELPRVLASKLLGATAQYRIKIPVDALSKDGKIYSCFTREISEDNLNLPEVTDLARIAPDSMLFQSFGHEHQLFFMQLYRKFLPDLFMVYELDDLKSEMPAKNPISRTMFTDFKRRLRAALNVCDRFIVTSEPLKEAYADLFEDIRVIPNYLPGNIWNGLNSRRRASLKPRVGWAGAMQHQGDLEVIIDAVKETANEIDWVFFGMCPDEIRPFIREFHGPVEMANYPEKLAALNLDLAVAPLEYHRFNEAKSSLRILEYGSLGWPVIATDIYPYQLNAPGVWLVRNNTKAWVDAIREKVHDLNATALAGDQLRMWVKQGWMIEQHLDEWFDALVSDKLKAQIRFDVQLRA